MCLVLLNVHLYICTYFFYPCVLSVSLLCFVLLINVFCYFRANMASDESTAALAQSQSQILSTEQDDDNDTDIIEKVQEMKIQRNESNVSETTAPAKKKSVKKKK